MERSIPGFRGAAEQKKMKTITLTEKEMHSGNLIVVNAVHPYREEASERERPVQNTDVSEEELSVRNTDVQEGGLPFQDAAVPKRKLLPVCLERPDILLEEQALLQLSALMNEIGGREEIVPVSGFRSYREQQEIFDTSLRENGEAYTRKFVALPGCSEHQTGLAIDLALKKEEIDFICPEFPYEGICQRFRERAAAYGFIERYQEDKTDITGIAREPWHFRYTGRPHAEIMNVLGMCLEEYVEFLKQFPYGKRYYIYRMGAAEVRISYLPAGSSPAWFEAGNKGAVQFEAGNKSAVQSKAGDKSAVRFEAADEASYEISGNNIDGFIITERK